MQIIFDSKEECVESLCGCLCLKAKNNIRRKQIESTHREKAM
jgi:hypothetical protein